MKYYSLMRYANNAVGADFLYCTQDEVEDKKQEFKADYVEEISEQEYKKEKEREHRRFLRMATGYPK